MRNLNLRVFLSVLALYSIMLAATTAKAAPVQFNQVVQVVNAKPGKANTGGFAQLRLAGDDPVLTVGDDPKADAPPPVQDDRVITETRSEIVEEEVCDCEPIRAGGFPYWTLGFAALPLVFLIPPGDNIKSSTPTPTPPETPPTSTPTPTTTPTPPTTPTPTPEVPVPEPMTILLFGTGLASIGMAARRRFGKKEADETEE